MIILQIIHSRGVDVTYYQIHTISQQLLYRTIILILLSTRRPCRFLQRATVRAVLAIAFLSVSPSHAGLVSKMLSH